MLTNKEVQALKGTGKERRYADRDNLYLWVNAKGTVKSWQFKYRRPTDGKQDTYSIGRYPIISLKMARDEAYRLNRLVEGGFDPKEEAKKEKNARRPSVFNVIAAEFMQNKTDNVSAKRLQKLNGFLKNHINPVIGHLPVAEINGAQVLKMAKSIEAKGLKTVPQYCLSFVGEIMDYASATNITDNTINTRRLQSHLKADIVRHHPQVSMEELPKLLEDLETIKASPITVIALKLVLLLYPRQGAFRLAKWEHVDFERKTLLIPSVNNKGTLLQKRGGEVEQLIMLSSQAVCLLRQLYDFTGEHSSDFLFPSNVSKNRTMSAGTMNKALRQIVPPERQSVHGFRGLASTWLYNRFPEMGSVIEKTLNHKTGNNVERAYNHAKNLEQQRILWQAWADYLESQGLKIN